MAKAEITTPQGIQIKLEGTSAEISAVLQNLEQQPTGRTKRARRANKTKHARVSLVDLIDVLIDGGFFKKPRDLASIKSALAETGHHYPVTTLSPTMLRQVRRKSLRRLREDKRWLYVH